MRLGPWALTVTKQAEAAPATDKALTTVDGSRSWLSFIREVWTGAWQQNVEVSIDEATRHWAVYACISLIAQDIGKLRAKLVEYEGPIGKGIWTETESPAYTPVLRKPNHYQNRIKFFEWWITSKLMHGNTYVLKQRDDRQVVVGLYVLDPHKVRVLVADNGEVFYELRPDNLSKLDLARVIEGIPNVGEGVVLAPASEIIHDLHVALFHPLVGVSPIYACGYAALMGLKILKNSHWFFENLSRPGAILLADGAISETSATRIKSYWETNFSGGNAGKVAVLGDGLKYQAMSVSAADSQLIQQLKWTAENICACFHVPPYKIGVGPIPSYNNVEALNLEYYQQALQNPIESIELALDYGLGLQPDKIDGRILGVEMELDALFRMDTLTAVKVEAEKLKAGFGTPNEARRKFDLPPVKGGNTPYLQQQNYSLDALDRRDQAAPAPASAGATAARPTAGSPTATSTTPPPPRQLEAGLSDDAIAETAGELLMKELTAA